MLLSFICICIHTQITLFLPVFHISLFYWTVNSASVVFVMFFPSLLLLTCVTRTFISYVTSFSSVWLLHFFSMLAYDFCLWLEFSTLPDVCSMCRPVNIHHLLYQPVENCKEIFLAVLRTLQNLWGPLLLVAFLSFSPPSLDFVMLNNWSPKLITSGCLSVEKRGSKEMVTWVHTLIVR